MNNENTKAGSRKKGLHDQALSYKCSTEYKATRNPKTAELSTQGSH